MWAAAFAALLVARPSAQAPAPQADFADTLTRVSRYVESYYARARSLMVEETVMVQPVRADMTPDGFARWLVYDLRFEWNPDGENDKAKVQVVRELLRANNRPAKPDSEPKCLDPAPVTPEPLEFLLPERHGEYRFSSGVPTVMGGRAAILLEYSPRSSGVPSATVDPKGTGDKDCVSLDVPRRARGRVWVDPETAAVLRVDESLLGPTEIRLPKELLGRPGWGNGLYLTLSRSDSTVRYSPVTFSDPEETLMLPTTIENSWLTIAGSIRGVRMTQQYRNYRRFLTASRIVQE
jgi:hypothetical protein